MSFPIRILTMGITFTRMEGMNMNKEEDGFLRHFMQEEVKDLAEQMSDPENWRSKALREKISVMKEVKEDDQNSDS